MQCECVQVLSKARVSYSRSSVFQGGVCVWNTLILWVKLVEQIMHSYHASSARTSKPVQFSRLRQTLPSCFLVWTTLIDGWSEAHLFPESCLFGLLWTQRELNARPLAFTLVVLVHPYLKLTWSFCCFWSYLVFIYIAQYHEYTSRPPQS